MAEDLFDVFGRKQAKSQTLPGNHVALAVDGVEGLVGGDARSGERRKGPGRIESGDDGHQGHHRCR
jgi:hypothetical protein